MNFRRWTLSENNKTKRPGFAKAPKLQGWGHHALTRRQNARMWLGRLTIFVCLCYAGIWSESIKFACKAQIPMLGTEETWKKKNRRSNRNRTEEKQRKQGETKQTDGEEQTARKTKETEERSKEKESHHQAGQSNTTNNATLTRVKPIRMKLEASDNEAQPATHAKHSTAQQRSSKASCKQPNETKHGKVVQGRARHIHTKLVDKERQYIMQSQERVAANESYAKGISTRQRHTHITK